MIILGVDPGTIFTGYGLIQYDQNSFTKIQHGLIKLPSTKSLPQKLEIIYDELDRVIKLYKPDEFSIETAFYGKNVQSAMKIGYARGVSLLVAVHNSLPASEYSPREIKKSVVGNGAASKEQVFFMISTLLNLKNVKMRFDESDALAVALCHAFRLNTPLRKGKSWKDFVEAFPERIIQN
jgi:crossover junction endodeoxyribonuclease RuvC